MLKLARHVTIQSGRSISSVLTALRDITQDEAVSRRDWNRSLPFFGTIEAPEFVVYNMPIPLAKNYTLEVRGRFRQEADGLSIELKLRPCRFVRIFMRIWFGFLTLMFLLLLYSVKELHPFVILTGMALFGFLLNQILFRAHSRQIIAKLTESIS